MIYLNSVTVNQNKMSLINHGDVVDPFRLDTNFVKNYAHVEPKFGFDGVGKFVCARTYSRVKDCGKKEEWFEIVERVVNGTYTMQKKWIASSGIEWNPRKAQRSAQEMYDRIFHFKFLPPGRGLWAMGSPITEERNLFTALNNCFRGDVEVLTREHGFKAFQGMVNQPITVMTKSGKWVETTVQCFGEQRLWEVVLSRQGKVMTLMCTGNHIWFVDDFEEVETQNLTIGSQLQYVFGTPSNQAEDPEAVYHGICYGDGNYQQLPQMSCDKSYLYGWMKGYFATAGSVHKDGQLTISSTIEEDITFFKNAAAICGIGAFEVLQFDGRYTLSLIASTVDESFFISNDHLHACKDVKDVQLDLSWSVVSVTQTDIVEAVYCVTVPDTESFVIQGNILTHNCAFVSTRMIAQQGQRCKPFVFLMDSSMLGVGTGFDTKGAGSFVVHGIDDTTPRERFVIPDSREGWCESLELLLAACFNGGPDIDFDYSQLRKKGQPIKGFGGVASGYEPLKNLHQNVREVCEKNRGSPITITTIVDIMNMIGVCVVAGNVRRCLPKGTLVHTSEGLIPIENVKPGMMARTSSGFSKISELVDQGTQDLVNIKNEMGEFHCTAKHKIAVMTSVDTYEWKEAQHLSPGDCMVFVVKGTAMGNPSHALDLHEFPDLKTPELDEDLAWFMGVFSCAGICYDKRAYVCINSSDRVLVDRVVEQLDRFNVDIDIIEPSHEHLYRVYAQSSELSKFLSKTFFTTPDFILTGDLRIRSAYLRGRFDSGLLDESHIPSNQAKLQALYASTGVPTHMDQESGTLTPFKNFDAPSGLLGIKVFSVEPAHQMETYDISVPAAKEFVAGPGLLVHNTAEIVFGDPENDEYINLKNWSLNPHRGAYGWTSNNSVFAKQGMDYNKVAAITAANGEPGYAWLDNMKKYGRMNGTENHNDWRAEGGNPCVPGWTMIQTDLGVFSVSNLLGKPFKAKVNGKLYDCYDGFFKTGTKEVFTLATEEGHSVDLTADHKVLTVMGWKEAQDLTYGDLILLNINKGERLIESDVQKMQNAFYSHGSFVKNILTFHYEHQGDVKKLQTLLLKYGVNSCMYGTKLVVIGCNLKVFDTITQCIQIMPWEELDPELYLATFKDLTFKGKFDVYDCIVEEVHRFSADGIIVHNCLEQTLESYEMCCLVEVFPFNCVDKADFLRTLKFSYLYAKTVTLGKTHWPETNRVMLRNRRIGNSLSGIAQFVTRHGLETLREWCEEGYAEIQKYDTIYSDWFCIPRSIKTTSIKPSGTISLLAGATSGVHYPISQYYIRRVRINSNSKLLPPLIAAGYKVEPQLIAKGFDPATGRVTATEEDPTTSVVEFVVNSGEGIRAEHEISMWEQLALAAFMQRHWADNQVSCTIKFDQEREGPHIAHALNYYQYQLKGISFLPHSGHGYLQAPYEPIDKETYEAAKARYGVLDFNEAAEKPQVEMYCENDTCMLR